MQDDKTQDLLAWLGMRSTLRTAVARHLGGFLGMMLLLLFALALIAALVALLRVIGGGFDQNAGSSLGAGALIVALLSAPFLLWNVVIKQKALDFQKEGHITDRINTAVEMLGAEKTIKTDKGERTTPNFEVRLGALLSLERIAQDSIAYDHGRDHVRVMEILCAYIRHNAPAAKATAFPEELAGESGLRKNFREWAQGLKQPAPDIQLALTIMGRRSLRQRQYEAIWGQAHRRGDPLPDITPPDYPDVDNREAHKEYIKAFEAWHKRALTGYRLDLRGCNLQRADMDGANFIGTNFTGCYFAGASLKRAHLQGARLNYAYLQGAVLDDAHLQGAWLNYAHLQGAALNRTHLQGASLLGADLQGANLRDVEISRETNFDSASLVESKLQNIDMRLTSLRQEQLDGAFGDGSVRIPSGRRWPAHWPEWRLNIFAYPDQYKKWRADPDGYVPPDPPHGYDGPIRGEEQQKRPGNPA